MNIFRDPRWGRGQETPGEDPFLTGTYAAVYVRGLQNSEHRGGGLRISACCKHFDAYSLEFWDGVSRYEFDAVVTTQDLTDTYLPAFRSCVVRGGASCIMCAYNEVNGVPMCANKPFLTGLARDKWAFDGYITSDCDAVRNVLDPHNYTHSMPETIGAVMNAGMVRRALTWLQLPPLCTRCGARRLVAWRMCFWFDACVDGRRQDFLSARPLPSARSPRPLRRTSTAATAWASLRWTKPSPKATSRKRRRAFPAPSPAPPVSRAQSRNAYTYTYAEPLLGCSLSLLHNRTETCKEAACSL